MWRVTIRGLAAAKLRFALTGLAVVLGTAFVSGALVFGDTLQEGFEELFTQITGDADVVVEPDEDDVDDGEREHIPAGLLADVRALDEVAVADGEMEGTAVLIDDGEPIGEFGPPTLATGRSAEPELDAGELRHGRWPQAEGEIAVDADTAGAQDWQVGEDVAVAFEGPAEDAEIVGTFGVGEFDNLGGATVVVLDRDTAADKLGTDGDFTALSALAAEGVGDDELVDALGGAVGGDYTVHTAEEAVEDELEAVTEMVGVFSTGLLVFAGVSLLVGGFLIFNTFSIVLAQRLRELALLRAVGAGRGQLFASVLGEAGMVGLLGGAVGAAAGVGVAEALHALMGQLGLSLPGDELVLQPRTVAVAVGLGVAVTVVAAAAPARRAVRVPPVAALQQGAAAAVAGRGWPRTAAGGLLVAGGAAALAAGLFADAGVAAVGAGAVAVILGVAALSRLVAKPLAAAIGWPAARLRGVRGQLARVNAMRNPRRTAATASALMIGLALVAFVAIFADSLRTSTSEAIDQTFATDLIMHATVAEGLPEAAVDDVESADEVAMVATQADEPVDIDGEEHRVAVMDGDDMVAAFDFHAVDGDPGDVRDGGVLVAEAEAEDAGVAAGDTVTVDTPDGERSLPVAAVVEPPGMQAGWFVERDSYGGDVAGPTRMAYVDLADGVAADDGEAAVADALEDYPQVAMVDRAGLVDLASEQINQLLGVMVALLALSVLIALLGIVNTLALSVVERVREIGLLRAVGMTRPQVRAMVRSEASIVALLGAVLGVGLGVTFGATFVSAFDEIGIEHLTIPWAPIVVGLVLAALAGMLAGVLPARRAARQNVLAAIATE